jgi:transcriptional regulator with GAF, ATPase, and Fis domain
VDIEALHEVVLGAAVAGSSEAVLRQVVEGIAACPHVVLARIWLVRRAAGGVGVASWLELAASAGNFMHSEVDPRARDGRLARVELGQGKVGRVAETGVGLHLEQGPEHGPGELPSPLDLAWARAERVVAFAAHPLTAGGELLGVLALFDRRSLPAAEVARLGVLAGRAAEALSQALEREELRAECARAERENAWLRAEVHAPFLEILGRSPGLLDVLHRLEKVAPTDASVLVLGEPGVGKELMAHALHARSARRDEPLVRVGCAGPPRGRASGEALEEELFGRGGPGLLELADGGTLYLDEVGELPLALQAKLLRVLAEGAFERIGDPHTRRVSVRIVAATSRDLPEEIARGTFRDDLYYRLSGFPIRVPPLRERREDVPELAAHFVELAARRLRLPSPVLTQAQERVLASYDWPGNVHELQSVIHRAVILGKGRVLELPDLVPGLVPRSPHPDKALTTLPELKRREREVIATAMQLTHGKVSGPGGAAEMLGVKPSTLESKLRAHGLRKRRPRSGG